MRRWGARCDQRRPRHCGIPHRSNLSKHVLLTGKIDESINESNRLTGAFHYERDRFPQYGNVSPYKPFNSPYIGDSRNFNLNYTHTFSLTIVNETRAGLNRNLAGYPFPFTFPVLVEDKTGSALPGTNPNLPQTFTENTIFVDDLRQLPGAGRPTRWAENYRRIRNGSVFAPEEGGWYEFNSLGTPAGAPTFCDPNDQTGSGCTFSQDAPYILELTLNPSISTLRCRSFTAASVKKKGPCSSRTTLRSLAS